jgi:hypothetical protein
LDNEPFCQADAGDWASVAYHLARERKTAGHSLWYHRFYPAIYIYIIYW